VSENRSEQDVIIEQGLDGDLPVGGGGEDGQLEPLMSGADLARVALHAAREDARRRGALARTDKAKRTKAAVQAGRSRRPGSREPGGFGAALGALMADRAWSVPVSGGTVLGSWPDIAPELAQNVAAVAFDLDTGALDLRPTSPAYATRLRLTSAELLRRISEHTGDQAVRSLRILAPGHAPLPGAERSTAVPAPAAAVAPGPPSAGYLAVKAAYQATRADTGPAAPVREAIERQTQALMEHREPEQLFTKPVVLEEELRELEQQRRSRDVQRRAEEKARADRAARHLPTITPQAAPASLGRTA
jgi:predicted nucleic acid-binding Zn ribbon protein